MIHMLVLGLLFRDKWPLRCGICEMQCPQPLFVVMHLDAVHGM